MKKNILLLILVLLSLSACHKLEYNKADIDAQYAQTLNINLTINATAESFENIVATVNVSDLNDILEAGIMVSQTSDFSTYSTYDVYELETTFSINIPTRGSTKYYIKSYAYTPYGTYTSEPTTITTPEAPKLKFPEGYYQALDSWFDYMDTSSWLERSPEEAYNVTVRWHTEGDSLYIQGLYGINERLYGKYTPTPTGGILKIHVTFDGIPYGYSNSGLQVICAVNIEEMQYEEDITFEFTKGTSDDEATIQTSQYVLITRTGTGTDYDYGWHKTHMIKQTL